MLTDPPYHSSPISEVCGQELVKSGQEGPSFPFSGDPAIPFRSPLVFDIKYSNLIYILIFQFAATVV